MAWKHTEHGTIDYSEFNKFYEIDENTSDEDICEVLEQATHALNHEDEAYVPAIRQAMTRLKLKENEKAR